MLKQKYKSGLNKKLDLDTICGNRYYRNEMTASKVLAALAILKRWKAFKNRKIKARRSQQHNNLIHDLTKRT